MSPTDAPRAPSSAVVVASGIAARPASLPAALISSAVRAAVPDGASTFAWVMELDDFRRFKVTGRFGSKLHH